MLPKKESKILQENLHPRTRANFVSKIFSWWQLPLIIRGYKKQTTEKDLYEVHESSRLGDKLELAWDAERKRKNPSLWLALRTVFLADFWSIAPLVIIVELVLKTSQPVFLGFLIQYCVEDQKSVSDQLVYIYTGCFLLITFLRVICANSYNLQSVHLGIRIRVACSSLIYRKVLKMNQRVLLEDQIVNLLSNDVYRFDYSLIFVHYVGLAPFIILTLLFCLSVTIGSTSFVCVGVMTIFVILQVLLSVKVATYRLRVAHATDKRIKLISEIISGIEIIKLYTWEKPFSKLVELTRKLELKEIATAAYVNCIMSSFSQFVDRTAIMFSLLTYVLTGNFVNARYVFVLYAYMDSARTGIITLLPIALTGLLETNTTVKRIESFLLKETPPSSRVETRNIIKSVTLKDISAKSTSTGNYILKHINLTAGQQEIVGVAGPVGAGKSALLHVILQELQSLEGDLQVQGGLSYASQQPWIFAGTVQENILFGQEMDLEKYNNVIKACALERDFLLFPYGDSSLVGDRGAVLSGGQKIRINLARCIYKDADIYLLDDALSGLDQRVGKEIFDNCLMGYLKNKCRILVTHQLQHLKFVDKICVLKDGEMMFCGNFNQIKHCEDDYLNVLVTDEISQESRSLSHCRENFKNGFERPKEVEDNFGFDVAGQYYKNYFAQTGHWCFTLFAFSLFIFGQVVASMCDFFLSFFINFEDKEKQRNTFFTSINCLYIYTGLVAFLTAIMLFRSVTFTKLCMRASGNLHKNLLTKVIHTAMKFFHLNSAGRILNRFSKDMGIIDEQLPLELLKTFQIFLSCISVAITVSIVNNWFIIPSAIFIILLYTFRTIYLPTNMNLKRIEATSRSPAFEHLASSLQGLITIRACNAEKQMKMHFDSYQNKNISACCLFTACHLCFAFWIDIHCCIFLTIIAITCIFFNEGMTGGDIGLAITQAMTLCNYLQVGMKSWCENDNRMISVPRVIEYTQLENEIDDGTKQPPQSWPERGKIQFESVSMKYSPQEPPVLKLLNFAINHGEKIGIVGRTGAGKSSLISAIFRLNPIEGNILVDGINLREIPLKDFRSKISIIPQDPILFSDALRKNLDPFDEYEDDDLWKALEQVEIKQTVLDLPSGLLTNISEGGLNFSVGQRQLLCLARAALHNNKILILDEVTTNVDPLTDELVQNTVKEKFKHCTVLTIAHRLHTVMNSDRILVIDQGSVVEFDRPFLLLQKKGVLSQLVYQAEPEVVEVLTKIAEENYFTPNSF